MNSGEEVLVFPDTEQSQIYSRLTGGDDSKAHRIITWTLLPMMILFSFFGFIMMLLLSTWIGVSITAFPLLEGFIVGSTVVLSLVFAFQLCLIFVMWKASKSFIDDERIIFFLRKIKGQFGIVTIIMMILVIGFTGYSSIEGFTDYRTDLFIYIQPEGERDIIDSNLVSERLDLDGISSFYGNNLILNSTISQEKETEYSGLIVEKNSNLVMRNTTINGGGKNGFIFEVKGNLKAYNCTFSGLSYSESEMDSGLKIYGDKEETSIFIDCSFCDIKGNALLIQTRDVSIRDCRFEEVGYDSIRIQNGKAIISNCSFRDNRGSVSAFGSEFTIDNCMISKNKKGVYSENSDGSVIRTRFENISDYAIQYYDEMPDIKDCEYINCEVDIDEKEYLSKQLVCFLIVPAIIILSCLIIIITTKTTNVIVERRLIKKLNDIIRRPKRVEIPKERIQFDVDWKKNHYYRFLIITYGLALVLIGILLTILLKMVMDLPTYETLQLSLMLVVMVYILVFIPGLYIKTKRNGMIYYPTSYYFNWKGLYLRFKMYVNYRIPWKEIKKAEYNRRTGVIVIHLNKKLDHLKSQKRSKKGNRFALLVRGKEQDMILENIHKSRSG